MDVILWSVLGCVDADAVTIAISLITLLDIFGGFIHTYNNIGLNRMKDVETWQQKVENQFLIFQIRN